MGLSAHFRNLKVNDPAGFTKAVFESLNIPFAQVQHINIRQTAVRQELDRYHQAANAAAAYEQGKAPASSLTGYTDLPNPQNPIYALSPAQLEAIVAGTEQTTPGLPASATLTSLPTPRTL